MSSNLLFSFDYISISVCANVPRVDQISMKFLRFVFFGMEVDV